MYVLSAYLHKDKMVGRAKGGRSGAPGRAPRMVANYGEASSRSAISSNLVTLFQFLPVPDVFSVFSITGYDNFGRTMPLGK